MEQIYTIPVNIAFDESRDDKSLGCPCCNLYKKLESDELSIIMGASMMEPDIRIQTNKKGFCKKHYGKMLTMGNRLSIALMLESHLDAVRKNTEGGIVPFVSLKGKGKSALHELEESCYVCERIENNMTHMIETAVILWERDMEFRKKFAEQPYFCLPHYRRMKEYAKNKLSKREFGEFSKEIDKVLNTYFDELRGDVSHFCKKFDYRYENEPWGNSKDSIERAVKLLEGDF